MPKFNQATGDVADQRPIQPNLRQLQPRFKNAAGQCDATQRTSGGLSNAGNATLSHYTITRSAGGLRTAGFVSVGHVSPQQ